VGQNDAAVTAVERAIQMDPLSTVVCEAAAGVYYGVRRFDRCIAECDRGIELSPRDSLLQYFKGLSLHFMNDAEGAEASLLASHETWHGHAIPRAALGIVAAGRGDLAGARVIEKALRTEKVDPYTIAGLSCALGDETGALDLLEQVFKQRSPNLLNLRAEPVFDRLRQHPRFQRLVKAIGLEFKPE
jgi:hypothetical protein